jgi:CheY-like chemotaxis protein
MSGKTKKGCRVVLLAEDDVEMRLLLSLALQKEGCSVIECKDGMDLLSKVEPLLNRKKEVDYDLIVTDIRMPGVSGMEVVEGLAGLQVCPPIVLITAFGDAQTHEQGRQLGVAAVLDKPFEIGDFIRVIDDVLARKEDF